MRLRGIPRGPRELQRALLALGTLRQQGWFDRTQSVPWMTYPAIRFLDSLDTSASSVLEFGSGASTVWLNARFGSMLSIEHDPVWYAGQTGVNLVLRDHQGDVYRGPADSAYLQAGRLDAPWDVVVVDGMARLTCVEYIDDFVAGDGLVVLDDSDMEQLQPARRMLAEKGFAGIDFWGFKPGMGLHTCTSVYCREFSRWLHPRRV